MCRARVLGVVPTLNDKARNSPIRPKPMKPYVVRLVSEEANVRR